MNIFVLNLQFPNSLENATQQYIHTGYISDADYIYYSRDSYLNDTWTCLKNAHEGDLCLFMQTKSSKARISKLKRKALENHEETLLSMADSHLNQESVAPTLRRRAAFELSLLGALELSRQAYLEHGGQVFAYGFVDGEIIPLDLRINNRASKSVNGACHYARVKVLPHPFDISSYLKINRFGSITRVPGELEEMVLAELGVKDESKR